MLSSNLVRIRNGIPLCHSFAKFSQYPTRFKYGSDQIIKRGVPTIWSKYDKNNCEDWLSSYEKNGFYLFDNMYSGEEFAKIKQITDELKNGEIDHDLYTVKEPKTDDIRSIFESHKLNHFFKLVNTTKMQQVAETILGSKTYIYQSRINYQLPFVGTGFYWHSDFETWHAEDGMAVPRCVSGVLLLTDNNQYNGALMVLPGSHKEFIGCVNETPEKAWEISLKDNLTFGVPSHESVEKMINKYGIYQISAKAGSVFFFDSNLLHGSYTNITPFPRSNVYMVYNSVDNKPGEPFYSPNKKRRPTYLATRD